MKKAKVTTHPLHLLMADFDDIKNPLLAAGQAIATQEVGRRLVAMGHSLEVLCSRFPGYQDRTENGIRYTHIGLGSSNIKLNNAAYILALPWALKRKSRHADIVIECFTAPQSVLGTPLFTDKPVVVIPSCFDAARFERLYHVPLVWIERLGLKLYRYFLPYSTAILAKIRAHNKTAACEIVPEGVDEAFFAFRRASAQHILFLGRMDIEQKGIDLLLQAYAALNAKQPSTLPLVIAGNGPDEKRVAQLVSRLHLEKKVTLLGATYGAKKQRVMETAAFVALTSRNETFSCFGLEALAAGLPLVTFDIPELAWTGTDICMKARAFDVEHLAAVLHRMSAQATDLSAAARAFARNFTWDHVAEQYSAFFIRAYTESQSTVSTNTTAAQKVA